MPCIDLKDNSGLDLQIEPDETSAIQKYFKTFPELFAAGSSFSKVASLAIQDPAVTSFQTNLSLSQPVPVGTSEIGFTIKAGINSTVGIFVPDPHLAPGENDPLFGPDKYGEDVPVSPTERYVTFGFTGTVESSVSSRVSNFQFGFDPSSSFSITNYQKFSTAPLPLTVSQAVAQTIAHFQLPGNIEDLQAMQPNSIMTLSGTGGLKFSASANLLTVANPLALADLPPLSSLMVSEGSSVAVGGSYRLFGDYEIRVRKVGPNIVRLGYFKEHSSEWKASVTAKVGFDFSFGEDDLFAKLISAISPNARADFDKLKNARLDAGTTAAIQATVQAGVQRTLELALSFELGSLSAKEAAFLYEVDLQALDPNGRQAILDALGGDLTRLLADEDHLPAGIKAIQNIFTNLRQAKYVFRINLLGIYNFISVSELILKGQTLFDAETGEVTLTDTATASRIKTGALNVGGKPNAADPRQLHKLLASSFLITASYRASGAVLTPPRLMFSQTYCEMHEQTNRETMQDELGAAIGLGLLTGEEAKSLLRGGGNFGRTIAYASAGYNDSLATALFLNGEGTPRTMTEYEVVGREAMQVTIHNDAADRFRLEPLQNDNLWNQMKAKGQPGFRQLFRSLSEAQIGAITADYTTIVWWAKTMSDTAQKLAEIRRCVTSSSVADTEAFEKLRRDFADHLKSVAADTREEFDRPWGLIATDCLTNHRSNARVTLTGPVVSFTRQRQE